MRLSNRQLDNKKSQFIRCGMLHHPPFLSNKNLHNTTTKDATITCKKGNKKNKDRERERERETEEVKKKL